MLKVLEEDFARIPDLLARTGDVPVAHDESAPAVAAEPEAVQLGLF